MQTDPDTNTGNGFDPHSAQHASLSATISRVRFRRRVRRAAAASVVLMAVAAAVWLAMPTTSPGPGPGPQPVADSIRIRSTPLTTEQKIVSSVTPGLFIRTRAESAVAVRVTTPPGTGVPRLGESEFRALLAAHDVYLIQISGGAPEVRPLRPE